MMSWSCWNWYCNHSCFHFLNSKKTWSLLGCENNLKNLKNYNSIISIQSTAINPLPKSKTESHTHNGNTLKLHFESSIAGDYKSVANISDQRKKKEE